MTNIFGKNRIVKVFSVESSYSSEFDDWFIDKMNFTGQSLMLKSASQEEVCNKINLSRKKYKAVISKADIYVMDKKTNEPILCLKRTEDADTDCE